MDVYCWSSTNYTENDMHTTVSLSNNKIFGDRYSILPLDTVAGWMRDVRSLRMISSNNYIKVSPDMYANNDNDAITVIRSCGRYCYLLVFPDYCVISDVMLRFTKYLCMSGDTYYHPRVAISLGYLDVQNNVYDVNRIVNILNHIV